MAIVTIHSDFGAQENKICHCFLFFPIYLPWSDGNQMPWSSSFWMLSFKLASSVKRLPTIRETWVWSLGQEDPLEKEMETHSRILVWKIPWTEEPGRLQSMEPPIVGHNWATSSCCAVRISCVSKGRETKLTLGYPQFRNLSLVVAKEETEPFLTLSSKKNES